MGVNITFHEIGGEGGGKFHISSKIIPFLEIKINGVARCSLFIGGEMIWSSEWQLTTQCSTHSPNFCKEERITIYVLPHTAKDK